MQCNNGKYGATNKKLYFSDFTESRVAHLFIHNVNPYIVNTKIKFSIFTECDSKISESQ